MGQNTHSINSNKVSSLLEGVTSAGASSAQLMPASKVTFQISGITTATVEIEGSHDGTIWTSLSSITADGGYVLPDPWKYIRANVTSYTSGTINTTMCW